MYGIAYNLSVVNVYAIVNNHRLHLLLNSIVGIYALYLYILLRIAISRPTLQRYVYIYIA